jgi:hypothetical protein
MKKNIPAVGVAPDAQQIWHEVSDQAAADRRMERRVPLVFPIEVSGVNAENKNFIEQTYTLNVSLSGCCFQTLQHLTRGTRIGINLADREAQQTSELQVQYEVGWAELLGDLWIVGAQKITPGSIWRAEWNNL